CPFYKAFLVTTDVPEIYIKEFWATANVHQHSIQFKMDNKKHILDLESFRNILHICPRVQGQSFAELPFEEEILDFIRFLRHNATIRTLTDTFGYDSLRLSQAQILWRLYHKRNVDYAFLIWEDFVFQVKHKNQKKSNEMYYPRFTKVIIHHFMSKDLSIPQRNKVNWHYVRDDFMFLTIKLVSRHQNTQQFGALLPIELTNEEIRNSKAYKEYYAIATGEAAPKPKARVLDVPTDESEKELSWNSSDDEGADDKGKDSDGDKDDEGDDSEKGKEDDDGEEQEVVKNDDKDDTEESGDDDKEGSSDEEDDDEETRDEEGFDPIPQTPEDSEDDGDGEEDLGLNIGEEERHDEEEEEDELYRDVNINQGRGLQASLEIEDSHVTLTLVKPDGQQESSSVSSQFVTSLLNPKLDAGMESIFETASTSVASLPIPAPPMTPSTIATITTTSQAPIPPTTLPSDITQTLPNFALVFRFDDRLRSLEENFSEFRQTN
nr:hypothetical protein [Tanacetum cinerariifolium]